ncbi:G-protein coupled receptor 35 [Echinops telfairi]|uniref:G-protein coupled receptor 35 n=1 Tax=Echinops telfairi TaxID=9371 RepID=A0ABM0IK85_ECHTE|nr:G-protein coupled receptor 35 [Echinops telfairi]
MNTSCNSTLQAWLTLENPVAKAYTGSLLVLGLLLNGLALWVLCCRLPQWTETRVYMTNLAAADLCLLCSLPFMLYSLKGQEDTLLCQLSQAIYLVNRYMSISLVTAIAVDRYLAVRHALRARGLRSPRQAAAVCAVLWALVTSSLVLRWVLGMQDGGFCFSSSSKRPNNTMLFSLLGFYLPLALLVYCSLQVLLSLARRPAADPAQAEATRKASRVVWANLVVFVVCFLPLHLVLTVSFSMVPHSCAWRLRFRCLIYLTSRLSDANCCLDAICYYYMAKEFQEVCKAGLTAKAHKSQDSLCVTLT